MPYTNKISSLAKTVVYNPITNGLIDVIKAFVPGILSNLISDILSKWLQIDTPAGAGVVLSAAIASLFVYLRYRGKSSVVKFIKPDSYINGKIESEVQMDGNLYTVALFIQNMCGNFLKIPLNSESLLYYLVPLIPAIEGAAGSMVLSSYRRKLQNFISDLIYQLISSNQMVTERSITQLLIEKFPHNQYRFVPAQFLRPIIRNQMVNYLESHGYKLYDTKLTMNTSEFDNWKIRRNPEFQKAKATS